MDIKEVVEAGRITVDIGVRAYQETGVLPVQGHNEFCGMGVVAAAMKLPCRGVYINSVRVYYNHGALADILGVPYVFGFISSFDGNCPSFSAVIQHYSEEAVSRYYQGHEDGSRLWEAVKDGVPLVEDNEACEVQEERELVLA